LGNTDQKSEISSSSQEKKYKEIAFHITLEFPDDEETGELRKVMSAVNCSTCNQFGKDTHCCGLHRKLTAEEFASGEMACDGEKHTPVFTKYQVDDICNVWAYNVAKRRTKSDEHSETSTPMLTSTSDDL
jgi:hypothetical protein